jgi:hypothetical protein
MKTKLQLSPIAAAAAVTGVSLALGLLFNFLLFDHYPGLAWPLYTLAVVAGLTGLAWTLGRRLPSPVLWLLLPLAFFAAMVAVRASLPLTLLNILATVLLLLLVARLTAGGRLTSFGLADYLRVPFVPFRFLKPLAGTFSELFAMRSAVKSHPLSTQIIKGIVLAIPALIIFGLLLSSADMVFQKYLTDAFKLNISEDVWARSLVIILVTLAFAGAYSYIFGRADKPTDDRRNWQMPAFSRVESSIVLGSVAALFFVFILVQLAYLFGGQANISAQGFTYAEYARKGFFELLVVALLSFGMLWLGDKTVTRPSAGHSGAFKLLSALLIAEVLVIMASAFTRLFLYEQAYGFTTPRLYSHIFVIFLAVIFILLLIKILRALPEARFALPAFIAAVAFLVGLNLLNPDAFIAQQNLDRFHQTGKLDGIYLGELSADAHSEIQEALRIAPPEIKQEIKYSQSQQPEANAWQSWNLARSQADR